MFKIPVKFVFIVIVLSSKFVALIVAVCPSATEIVSKLSNVTPDKSTVPIKLKVSVPPAASRIVTFGVPV